MKKMLVFLAIIVALFGLLYFISAQSNKVGADNPYGTGNLNAATKKQLTDPNYQNIILPDALAQKLTNKEEVFVYFFSPTCTHCVATTPVVNPIAKELGVDLKQFNLLEFEDGWSTYRITGTPTIVYYKDGKEAARIENGVGEPGSGGNTPEAFKTFFQTHKK